MTGYNLPPGCNVSDIPGNRPEDEEWEKFYAHIEETIAELALDSLEARVLWDYVISKLRNKDVTVIELIKNSRPYEED